MLGLAEFAPVKGEEEARAKFMARLEAAAGNLAELAESKKALGDNLKDKNVQIDETDGRAFNNLKLLAQIGRATFKALGDTAHSRLYVLASLWKGGAVPGKVEDNGAAPQAGANQ